MENELSLQDRVAALETKTEELEAVALSFGTLMPKLVELADIVNGSASDTSETQTPKKKRSRTPQVKVPEDVSETAFFVYIDEEWKLKIPAELIDDPVAEIEWDDGIWIAVPVYKHNKGSPIVKMHLVSEVSEPFEDKNTGSWFCFADRDNHVISPKSAIDAPDHVKELRATAYADR